MSKKEKKVLIVLEDIFAASDYIDPVEHDILKNEIKYNQINDISKISV